MTGETIKEFLVGLGFDVDEAGLSKFKAGLAGATVAATAIATAVVGAAGAVTAFVAGVAHELDSLSDFADLVGESAEAVSELEAVAVIADSSVEAVRSSLRGVSNMAGQAALGVGRGAMVFKKLGLEAKTAEGRMKTASELLAEVGDRVKGLSKAEQIAFTSKLGIDPTLVKSLVGNYDEIRAEHRRVFESLGVDLNAAAEAGSDFEDSQNRLRGVIDAAYKAVGVRLMPQVKRGLDALRQGLVANLPRIVAVLAPMLDVVLRIAEALVTLGGRAVQGLGALLGALQRVNDATDGWAGYIAAAVAAWRFLNLAILKSPVGIILALAAGVALLVDDFLTWKEGGISLIDWSSTFGQTLLALGAAVTGLGTAFLVVRGIMLAVSAASAIVTAAQGVMSLAIWAVNAAMLANPAGLMVAALFAIVAAVPLVLANLDTIKAWFTDAIAWITGWASKVGDVLGSIGSVLGFGGGPQLALAGGGAIPPGPAAAAGVAGREQNVSQKTEIRVEASPSAEATGRAIAREQGRVNGDLVRNLSRAAR